MARNFNKKNNGGARGAVDRINYSATGKVVCWADPAVSGAVLVSGLVLLVSLSCYSAISIIANILLLGVVVGAGSKIYVHLMGMLKKPCKDPLAQLALLDLTVTEDCVDGLVKSSTETFNHITSSLRSLLLGENLYSSVKFGLALYIITILGAMFNTLTILVISWVVAFVIPRVYEENQDSMDDLYAKVFDQYSAVDGKVAALFPGHKEVLAAQVEEKEE